MDKKPDAITNYSSSVSPGSNYGVNSPQDEEQPFGSVDLGTEQDTLKHKAVIKEDETNICDSRKPDITELCGVDKCEKHDTPGSSETEIGVGVKSEGQNTNGDCKHSRHCGKPAKKYAAGNCKIRSTVPQPFALATEERASHGTRRLDDNNGVRRPSNVNDLPNSGATKKSVVQLVSLMASRKLLKPDNKKQSNEDNCSVASSTVGSARKSKTSVASVPAFRCSERAERRKEFHTKLEEKHQALEAEKTQCDERTKEESQAAIKQLRKVLSFKASPMPSFYLEGLPPKVELKKPPPTRARSPKLGRRKSCSDAGDIEKGIGAYGRAPRESLSFYSKSLPSAPTTRNTVIVVQTGTASCKIKDQPQQEVEQHEPFALKVNEDRSVDITVHS